MDAYRARQIMQAEERIQVTYEGVPVWIDGIEEDSQTARVHTEGNPQDTKTVSVQQLMEQ